MRFSYQTWEIFIILLLYFGIGGLYVFFTPNWQAPDEPAHYNYIAEVSYNGCCPILKEGDWDAQYLELLKAEKFKPVLLNDLHTIRYENHQPPLYYLLSSLVFTVTEGFLPALRLLSLIFGSIIVICSYLIFRIIWPDRLLLAISATSFIAFLPQHIHILTSVNNDSLAWALISLTLFMSVKLVREASQHQTVSYCKIILLGILVGLCLLTKLTVYFSIIIGMVAVFFHWKISYSLKGKPQDNIKKLFQMWTLFIIPVVILGGVWWIRNLAVYGAFDFLGLQTHDRIVVGQKRTIDFIAEVGVKNYTRTVLNTTFTSFWGQFGWMALPLTGWPLRVAQALTLLGTGGAIISVLMHKKQTSPQIYYQLILLTLPGIFAISGYVYYNTAFLQLQGRYLFSGLLLFAFIMASGLEKWGQLTNHLLPKWRNHSYIITILPLIILPVFDIYLLFYIIEPNL